MKTKVSLVILLLAGWVLPSFAQERLDVALEKHVQALTHPSMTGRGVGTPGETMAARYISRYWKEHDLDFLYPNGIQDFSLVGPGQDTLRSQNIVAVISGTDPVLREEYIVVGAHYDHLGSYTMKVGDKDTLCVYAGANSNASGTAALMELARMCKEQSLRFKRSLLFVAFGAEEVGMMGSWYFINRAFKPVTSVKFMVNLDMMGRYTEQNTPRAYTGTLNDQTAALVAAAVAQPGGCNIRLMQQDPFPSDHKPFSEKGIPFCLFTTGLNPDYRTLRDLPSQVDYARFSAFTNAVFLFLEEVAATGVISPGAAVNPEEQSSEAPLYTYTEVEKAPAFQNGDLAVFEAWIYKYVRYPYDALRDGIQGTVSVSFVVEPDGQLSHIKVERSAGELLDAEALRVIRVSPKWRPGQKGGKKVRVKCVVPVHFKLAPTRR